MTTTPHDKAIQAAANGIQWTQDCTFETIAENVVRDYFSSIGGIVVPREPTPAMISAYCELQNGLGINAFANGRLAWEAMINASPLHAPIEAGNGGDGSIVRGWFVKDYADGWIYFDNEEDAKLQVDATGAMMLLGVAPYDLIAKSPAEQFARWLEDGPKLAKAAGCYVGIKVTNLPAPPSPSNEGEKP
ncbi:hypothetical protein [Rhizobium sp. AG207R]|uniref:hypothetical protein n=1 Tax=Rhizobium sp. AG207R TaxID=2802287 RepID=UPI0022AC8F77|nr:hypothetical protein [Rhizobium sp. AG207R]MCZ3377480.1 hypothetical protein [Rhizobium sp. AG207R]